MNRIEDFSEIELSNDIERSSKVGIYIIIFCVIALALVLFGYIVTNKGDSRLSDLVNNSVTTESDTVAETQSVTETQIVFDDTATETEPAVEVARATELPEVEPSESDRGSGIALNEKSITVDEVFDAGLIFVSASEPKYVITGEQRRIDLGDEIDEQTSLAGITSKSIVLDREGSLLVISLPKPLPE